MSFTFACSPITFQFTPSHKDINIHELFMVMHLCTLFDRFTYAIQFSTHIIPRIIFNQVPDLKCFA